MKILIIIVISFTSFLVNSFPIPKNDIATFDVVRKNKVIGSVETTFVKKNDELIVNTIIDIKVKVLFIPAYKFYQNSTEVWKNGEFIKFEGYTDFEDEREYFVNGEDKIDNFVVKGMDGSLSLDKDIIPLNYWNKKILNEKQVFDTQKGIIREIKVEQIEDEIIKINEKDVITSKYILNASTNPKDKGPFPEYTIWYAQNGELLKFKFINWKDNKEVVTQRNNWDY
jgi:hypothetical protein